MFGEQTAFDKRFAIANTNFSFSSCRSVSSTSAPRKPSFYLYNDFYFFRHSWFKVFCQFSTTQQGDTYHTCIPFGRALSHFRLGPTASPTPPLAPSQSFQAVFRTLGYLLLSTNVSAGVLGPSFADKAPAPAQCLSSRRQSNNARWMLLKKGAAALSISPPRSPWIEVSPPSFPLRLSRPAQVYSASFPRAPGIPT